MLSIPISELKVSYSIILKSELERVKIVEEGDSTKITNNLVQNTLQYKDLLNNK